MGRLSHLQQTFLDNVCNSESYVDREFVLLNYNSQDGLDEWARNHLLELIDQGIVKYYHTTQPRYYISTHAKNVAHKLASGDILCNLDADNFILPGFCEFVVDNLQSHRAILLASPQDPQGNIGTAGKVAVRREHFYSVNGYDEELNLGWGCDDTNFHYRAAQHTPISAGPGWSKAIPHSDEDRVVNFRLKDIRYSAELAWSRLEYLNKHRIWIANPNEWGQATLIKNFQDIITV